MAYHDAHDAAADSRSVADYRRDLDRLLTSQAETVAARVRAGIEGLAALREAFEFFADHDHPEDHPVPLAAAVRVLAAVRLTSRELVEFLRACERVRDHAAEAQSAAAQEAAGRDPSAA